MTVALVGAPGSGKTALAARMAACDDYRPLHVGRELRRLAARGDVELAARLADHHGSREVAAEVTAKLVSDWICRQQGRNVVLDGYPHPGVEASLLLQILARARRRLTALVVLDVDLRTARRRVVRSRNAARGDVRDDGDIVSERFVLASRRIAELREWASEAGCQICLVDASPPLPAVHVEVVRALEVARGSQAHA